MKTLPACCAVALAAVISPPLTPQEPSPETLEPVVVTAPVPEFDRSLHLLRLLVARSAPCLGCDAVRAPPSEAAAAELLRYLLLPAVPTPPSETERLLFDIKVADSPELDFLRP